MNIVDGNERNTFVGVKNRIKNIFVLLLQQTLVNLPLL